MAVTAVRTQERNRMLLQFHKEHPEASYEQLGKKFAISKQRAWHIVCQSQAGEKRKEKKDKFFRQYLYRSIQPWQGVTGEIFALTRPEQYFQRQLAITNRGTQREVLPINRMT